MTRADIAICWVNVHGGRYHALLHLRERLCREGLECALLLNSDPPLGLQKDVDLSPEQAAVLAAEGVHVGPLSGMAEALKATGARLCVFDAHDGGDVPGLMAAARGMGMLTAQTSTLLADYTYHGADYALVEHPLTLWIIFEYSRVRGAEALAGAKGVFFSGNVFYEPLLNTWTSALRSKEQLQAKYGLDPAKPTALWLPNREDGLSPEYGRIIEQARAAGFNLLVKLHPWEYKQLRHGFDPYGQGMTSAQKWGVPAMDECDTSWAFKYADVGIMRGSSMGLELPFWNMPGVIIACPPGPHAGWHAMLAAMTARTARHIDSVEELGQLLGPGWPFGITAADYEQAKRHTMPKGSGGEGQPDSLDLHARHLKAILEGRAAELAVEPRGSMSALRKAYTQDIPESFYKSLRPWQRALHAARRIIGLRG